MFPTLKTDFSSKTFPSPPKKIHRSSKKGNFTTKSTNFKSNSNKFDNIFTQKYEIFRLQTHLTVKTESKSVNLESIFKKFFQNSPVFYHIF